MMQLLLPQSDIVNGQLVPMRNQDAYWPSTLGPSLLGGVTPVPSVPPGAYGTTGVTPSEAQTTGNAMQTQAAAASPWSPTASPLPWVIFALIVGFLGLRYVHWDL